LRATNNQNNIANEGGGLSYMIRRWGQVKLLFSTIILYLSECMNNEEYTVCSQNRGEVDGLWEKNVCTKLHAFIIMRI
jgi:hypothetical protein